VRERRSCGEIESDVESDVESEVEWTGGRGGREGGGGRSERNGGRWRRWRTRRQRRRRRVETYICIGKCVPTPASLSPAIPPLLALSLSRSHSLSLSHSFSLALSLSRSRSLSLSPHVSLPPAYRTSFTPPSQTPAHSRSPAVPPRSAPVLRSSRSHSRCSLLVPSIPQSLPSRLAAPSLSLALSPSRFLPRRATARRASFFSPFFLSSFFLPSRTPYFSSARPRGRRVIFIICYLLRRAAPPAATVCPARPTRKNRKIEENKSGRRAAHPAGMPSSASAVDGNGGRWGRTRAVRGKDGRRRG